MEIILDHLMQRFAELGPDAHIGHGPQHPTNPDVKLMEQTQRWLRRHPFLTMDQGYVAFLHRYSGAEIEVPGRYGVFIAGFTGLGGVLNEIGPFEYDDEVSGVDEDGLCPFATVALGKEVLDFSFDASGNRPCGVYRTPRRLPLLSGTDEWDCKDFIEWLGNVVANCLAKN